MTQKKQLKTMPKFQKKKESSKISEQLQEKQGVGSRCGGEGRGDCERKKQGGIEQELKKLLALFYCIPQS